MPRSQLPVDALPRARLFDHRRRDGVRRRRRSTAAQSTSCCARICRRASPSTRPPRTRRAFPSLPCFNNLVFFDPSKPTESVDTIVGDLAEKWSWQDNYRNLVFFLRKDVKWHDGKPFTLEGRQVHLRHAPRGPGRAGQAPASTRARTGTRTWRRWKRRTPTRSSSGSSGRSPRCS